MAMIYNSIPYFPTQVSFFEEVAMELIEARYGMKAETAVMKLVCKIYKENGYYMVWNEEQCTLFTNKVGRGNCERRDAGNCGDTDGKGVLRQRNL